MGEAVGGWAIGGDEDGDAWDGGFGVAGDARGAGVSTRVRACGTASERLSGLSAAWYYVWRSSGNAVEGCYAGIARLTRRGAIFRYFSYTYVSIYNIHHVLSWHFCCLDSELAEMLADSCDSDSLIRYPFCMRSIRLRSEEVPSSILGTVKGVEDRKLHAEGM